MINDVNDAATVVYNPAHIAAKEAAWGKMSRNALDLFVNGNNANVNTIAKVNFEERVRFDHVNDKAYPVLVYQNGTQMLAWYDCENEHGYIA